MKAFISSDRMVHLELSQEEVAVAIEVFSLRTPEANEELRRGSPEWPDIAWEMHRDLILLLDYSPPTTPF